MESKEAWISRGDALTDAHVYLAFDGCFMQRSVVPVVSGAWVRPLTQQETHYLGVTKRTSVMERDEPTIITGVDICTCL